MSKHRIIPLVASLALAASALTMGATVSASGEHDEGGATPVAELQIPLLPRLPGVHVDAAALDGAVLGTPQAPRDVPITMTEGLRFQPDPVIVGAGETVRFLVDNPTAAEHSFLLGSLDTQIDHEVEMAGHGGGHADGEAAAGEGGLPGVVVVGPGESAEVVATFDGAGGLLIGCHRPGHWAAGMVAALVVLPVS